MLHKFLKGLISRCISTLDPSSEPALSEPKLNLILMNPDKACLHLASPIRGTKNYPFLSGPEGEGFKNLLYPYIYLRQRLSAMGIDLATKDINSPQDSFITFCLDDPHTITVKKQAGQIWCLFINDPPVYCPESWDISYHDQFDFVFTYDETRIDDKKYFYYPIAADTDFFSIPDIVSKEEFSERILATNISNAIHKYQDPKHPNCTHYRRYNTIEWYGQYHPNDFRFYGGTFLKRNYYFAFRGVGLIQKFVPGRFFQLVAKHAQKNLFRVFGGELLPLEKFDVIKNFNFYYCYENTTGITGYVTEKIFDCLYSGIVPIYWGAPNIKKLIPYDCFIDGRDFKDEESLYLYIKGMKYERYREYLEQARIFLRSKEMERFTVNNSIDSILAPLRNCIENRDN